MLLAFASVTWHLHSAQLRSSAARRPPHGQGRPPLAPLLLPQAAAGGGGNVDTAAHGPRVPAATRLQGEGAHPHLQACGLCCKLLGPRSPPSRRSCAHVASLLPVQAQARRLCTLQHTKQAAGPPWTLWQLHCPPLKLAAAKATCSRSSRLSR